MGMIRDLFSLTREAKELKRSTPTPSMREMVGQAREAVAQVNEMQAGAPGLLADGLPGTAIIREMGTPERGATWFNLMLDLEVHPRTREPYRLANEFMVPAAARLAPGTELTVRIDPENPARIAIDWNAAPQGPPLGEVRPL
jgi:hypothetical protein